MLMNKFVTYNTCNNTCKYAYDSQRIVKIFHIKNESL